MYDLAAKDLLSKGKNKVAAEEAKAVLRSVAVPLGFWHLALNADETLLAICYQRDVRVHTLHGLMRSEATPAASISFMAASISFMADPHAIVDFAWSRVTPTLFATLNSAHSVSAFEVAIPGNGSIKPLASRTDPQAPYIASTPALTPALTRMEHRYLAVRSFARRCLCVRSVVLAGAPLNRSRVDQRCDRHFGGGQALAGRAL